MRFLFHFYLLIDHSMIKPKKKTTDNVHLMKHQNKKTGEPHSLITTVYPFECTVIALHRCVIRSVWFEFYLVWNPEIGFPAARVKDSGAIIRSLEYSLCESNIIV